MKKFLILATFFLVLPVAHAANQYEWKGQFNVSGANVILQGGPFSSQSQCYNDAGTSPQAKYPGKTVTLNQPPGFTCTCDKPLSQQSSCPDYTPPSVAPAASAVTCPSGNDGDCPGNQVCDTSFPSSAQYVCVASDTAANGSGSVSTGGKCTVDGDCSGNLACIHNICQIDPSLENSGTAAPGGACLIANANSDCPGDQTCVAASSGSANGTCQGATGNAPAGGSTAPVSFVPLAPIPGLDSTIAPDKSGIASFLNNLYKYLIGIAAVLAIIEIIWGGLEISTKDSVSKNRDGKARIYQALLGLALVLLPVLVFTIINPGILNLNINMPALDLKRYSGINVTPVGPNQVVNSETTVNNQIKIADTTCASNLISSCGNAKAACISKNNLGTNAVFDYTCLKAGDGTQDMSAPTNIKGDLQACPSGDYAAVTCSENSSGPGGGHSF